MLSTSVNLDDAEGGELQFTYYNDNFSRVKPPAEIS